MLLPDDTFILSFMDSLFRFTKEGIEINRMDMFGKESTPKEGETKYESTKRGPIWRVGEDTIAKQYTLIREDAFHNYDLMPGVPHIYETKRCMKLWNYKTNSLSKEIELSGVSGHQQCQNSCLMRKTTNLGATEQSKRMFVYNSKKGGKKATQTPSFLFDESNNFIEESLQKGEQQQQSSSSQPIGRDGYDFQKNTTTNENTQKILFVSTRGCCSTRVFSSCDFDTLDDEENILSAGIDSYKNDSSTKKHPSTTSENWTPPVFFGDRVMPKSGSGDHKQLCVFGQNGIKYKSIISVTTLSNGETLFVYSYDLVRRMGEKSDVITDYKMLSMNVSDETNLVHYESSDKLTYYSIFAMELQNGLILGSDLKNHVYAWNRKGKLLLFKTLPPSVYSFFQLSDGTIAVLGVGSVTTYYDLMYSEESLVNKCCSSITEDFGTNPDTIYSKEVFSNVLPSELSSLCEDFSVGVSRKNA